jgi:hypothetical protein
MVLIDCPGKNCRNNYGQKSKIINKGEYMKRRIFLSVLSVLLLLWLASVVFSAEGDNYEPQQLKAATDENVLFYLPGVDVGFTALKTNDMPSLIMRSKNNASFKIANLSIVSLNEALTQDGKVLAFFVAEYTLKENGLITINNLIKNGSIEFENLLNTLQEDDFTINTSGSKKAPDPNEFAKLRNAFVYNFIIEDNGKKQFPMQVYVEKITDASELH